MANSGKLEKWRSKSEAEKHRVAVIGAVILTFAVIVVWTVNLFNSLSSNSLSAHSVAQPKDKTSVVSSLRQTVNEGMGKLQGEFTKVKNSAGALISVPDYVSTSSNVNDN